MIVVNGNEKCELMSKRLNLDVLGVLDTSINKVKIVTVFTMTFAHAVLTTVNIYTFRLTTAFPTFYASTCNKKIFRN